jgi:hypothetical protein
LIRSRAAAGREVTRWERESERDDNYRGGLARSWLQNGAFMWRCQVYKYYWQE